MGKWINSFRELDTWQRSFELSMAILHESRHFPREEQYSLTDQIRRSSRSVSANLAEAWAKRRYQANWISKLCDCQAEAMETQNWLLYAEKCGYLPTDSAKSMLQDYDGLIAAFDKMIEQAPQWSTK